MRGLVSQGSAFVHLIHVWGMSTVGQDVGEGECGGVGGPLRGNRTLEGLSAFLPPCLEAVPHLTGCDLSGVGSCT